jgi:uncharacterized protein
MTPYMYTTSVPIFKQLLNSISAILTKAEALATEKKFEPNVLLDARLFPDMFPLNPPSANRYRFCHERVSSVGRC